MTRSQSKLLSERLDLFALISTGLPSFSLRLRETTLKPDICFASPIQCVSPRGKISELRDSLRFQPHRSWISASRARGRDAVLFQAVGKTMESAAGFEWDTVRRGRRRSRPAR